MRVALRVVGVCLALGLLAAVMAQLAGLFEPKIPAGAEAPRQPAAGGREVPVEAVTEPIVEQATGTVQSRREAVISARITAAVLGVAVRPGDAVEAGETLARLDARDLEARLGQAREAVAAAAARVDGAAAEYRRIRPLAERGVATRAELDRVRSALDAAEAELARTRGLADEAATALSYTAITAPFAGRIQDRYADPGDTAAPGVPLLRLYDPEALRIAANVRESLAARLDRGDTLTARIDALDAELPVAVDEVVPSADPGSRTFVVKAALPARRNLFPGMFARLLIPAGTTHRYYIPAAAIERIGQLERVHVVAAGGQAAERRFIRTGRRRDDGRVEVLSGLRPPERVVVRPDGGG